MSVSRLVIFLSVILGITAAVHFFLWLRLVRDPAWPAPWSAIGTGVIVALALSIPVTFFITRLVSRTAATPLSWLAYVWMGTMFLLFVLLLSSEPVRAAVRIWMVKSPSSLDSPERRLFLSRTIAAFVGGGAAALSVLSLASALGPVKVKRVAVKLRNLPDPLRGFRIVQLTDVHVGPTIGRAFIETLVRQVNALEPDLIAITGDLVDGPVEELASQVAPLARLRSRHGVFFVTGNHEYYSGSEAWMGHLQTLGMRVLRNERVTIEHDGASIDVVGVHDFGASDFGRGPDLSRALAGKPEGRHTVLLAHQPRQVEEAAQHGVDLQLSGHTHGGQIFPFNFLVRLQQPYVAGLHDHRGTKIYVSAGTGYWGPPMRLAIPAEITEITLAS